MWSSQFDYQSLTVKESKVAKNVGINYPRTLPLRGSYKAKFGNVLYFKEMQCILYQLLEIINLNGKDV